MHLTDDVHARGAAMVARALTMPDLTGVSRLVIFAEEAEVLHRPRDGSPGLYGAMLANLRALNQSDAALARAFDEA